MKNTLKSKAAFLILAAAIIIPFALSVSAQQPLQNYRAGTAGFTAGKDGINITFSSPLPSTKYAVIVQPTNTAGYSTTTVCTYFNPLHKRVDGFEVQHKRCDNGVPVKLDTNVSLDWVVVEYR